MSTPRFCLSVLAAACVATAASAQQAAVTGEQTSASRAEAYSVTRESALQGKVVAYSATSAVAPLGAHVTVQTASGVVDVHLGNARLLTAAKMTLDSGDAVTIIGEALPFGAQTIFAARVIQKGGTAVTLRSPHGIPLVMAPRSANGQATAPAGAR